MMVQGFLLGVIATASVTASAFFFRFWRHTRDSLFFFFGIAFLIEGLNRTAVLFVEHPNEGSPWIYLVRLVSYALILAAILKKNYGGAD